MSRAAVGALELGRHVPAADAAIRLARVLGTTVEALFDEPRATPVVDVLGGAMPEGALVRVASVGHGRVATVVDPASMLAGAPADGMVRDGRVECFSGASARGAVAVGCDPLLGLAERLLDHGGAGRLVAVPATSGQAREALASGRCHIAVVHGPPDTLVVPPATQRWRLATWRSGVASHPALEVRGTDALLSGSVGVIGRSESAASQQALARAAAAVGADSPEPVAIASGHLEAARWAHERRAAAVTIEPVAVACGLDFLSLEIHDVEVWVPDRWVEEPGVAAFLDLLGSARFLDRARALPAYDLTATGTSR